MWYTHNGKRYICGNYTKHGNIDCSHHAIKEQQLIETILTDRKSIYKSFERLDTEKQIKNKVHELQKKNTIRLQTIEKQIQKQMDFKRNSLQKFIGGDISKKIITTLFVWYKTSYNRLFAGIFLQISSFLSSFFDTI